MAAPVDATRVSREPHSCSWASVAIGAAAITCSLHCNSPVHTQSSTLDEAAFGGAFVQVTQSGYGVVKLELDLLVSAGADPCPVVDGVQATAGGVPMHVDSPGSLGSQCRLDYSGACSGIYDPICLGPTWSLEGPPPGPLSIVLQDRSGTYAIDLPDVGTLRTIAVSSSTDGAAGQPGSATLTWSPASDAIDGWVPTPGANRYDSQGVQDIAFAPAVPGAFDTLDWPGSGSLYPHGVQVSGAELTVRADGATTSAATPPHGGQGVFSVQATAYLPVSRCAWADCQAFLTASPTVQAEWHPF